MKLIISCQEFEKICRSKGVSFYVDCSLLQKAPFQQRGFGGSMASKPKLYLQLARKEKSSMYSRGMLLDADKCVSCGWPVYCCRRSLGDFG